MIPPSRHLREQSGFTLVELLTVIAIIMILAAIIIPTVSRVRATSRAAVCLSNLRQISAAHTLYTSDNKRRVVPTATGTGSSDAITWRNYLGAYMQDSREVLRCPADISNVALPDKDPHSLSPSSYGIPLTTALHDYLRGNNPRNKTLSDVISPAKTIFVCDIGMVDNASLAPADWQQRASTSSFGYANMPSDPSWSSGGNWNAFPRHSGKINAVFYDGHAASIDIVQDLLAHTAAGDPLCLFRNQ